MRGLKILVIVMGALLVAGIAGLVVALATRMSHRAPPPVAAFSAPPIMLPHGSTIESMRVGADRIILQIDLADGSVQLFVIDLATGRQLGTIPLLEQP